MIEFSQLIIVVSLLCILLANCLVGVGEVDVQNHDGEA